MRLIIRLLINAAAIWVTARALPGISVADGFGNVLLVAVIFGVVNAFIRPIAKLLTLPLRIVTLGLFTFVINGLMVMLTAGLVDVLSLEGGFFRQLFTAILASILIGAVSMVLTWIVPDNDR